MDASAPPELGRIEYIRISLVQKPEKQQRQIEAFAQALAECRGNQTWLAKRMDERDRQIRRQILTARALGVDIPLRAIEIMREKKIVPYLSVPPGSAPIVNADEIYLAAIERATARAEAVQGAAAAKPPAVKKAAAKKKPRAKGVRRGASAKHPA